MDIIEIDINQIKPYIKNAKKHNRTQILNVAESIERYGYVQPIVVDKNYEIIIGHCRYEASREVGLETVPCIVKDDLSDERVKELRIVDNKTNESEWDLDLLKDEVAELDFDDFEFDFGIDIFSDDDISVDEISEIEDENEDKGKECECPNCGYKFYVE